MDKHWIKCLSKTFPDKHYYFNPHTGSAVWDLNDIKPPHLTNHLRRQYSQSENFPSINNFFSPFPYINNIPYQNGVPLTHFWISQPVYVMPVPIPVYRKEESDFLIQTTLNPLSSRFKNSRFDILKNDESSTNINKLRSCGDEDKIMHNHKNNVNVTNMRCKPDKKRIFADLNTTSGNQSKEIQDAFQSKSPRMIYASEAVNCDEMTENIYDYNTHNDDVSRIDVTYLKQWMKPNMRQDMWYIIVDTDMLLYKLTFIENLVKSDPTCRLMIPYCILCEVNSISSLSYHQVRVKLARKVNRFLSKELPTRRTVIGQTAQQATENASQKYLPSEILQCCKQLLEQHYFVVLISNDEKLRKNALLAKIQSCSFNQVLNLIKKQCKFLPFRKLTKCNEDFNASNIKRIDFDIKHTNYTKNNILTEITYDGDKLQINNTNNKNENKQKIRKTNEKTGPKNIVENIKIDNKNLKVYIKNDNFICDTVNSAVNEELDENHIFLEEFTFDLSFGSMVERYGEREAKEKILRIQNWNRQSALTIDEMEENKDGIEHVGISNRRRKVVHRKHQDIMIKRKLMRNRTKARMHKWAIRLSDVMFDALMKALKEKYKKLGLPDPNSKDLRNLGEAVKVYYRKDEEIRKRATELLAHLLYCCNKDGAIRYDLKLKEFTHLSSHSYNLLLSLKSSKDIKQKEHLDMALNLLNKILLKLRNLRSDTATNQMVDVEVANKLTKSNDKGDSVANMAGILEPMETIEAQDQVQSTIVRTIGDKIKLITLTKDKKISINYDELKANKEKSSHSAVNDSTSLKLTNDKKTIVTIQKTGKEDPIRYDESLKVFKNIKFSNNTEIFSEPAEVNESNDKILDDTENSYGNTDVREAIDLYLLDYSPMSLDIAVRDEFFKDERLHNNDNYTNQFEEIKHSKLTAVEDLKEDTLKDDDQIILNKYTVKATDYSVENDNGVVLINDAQKINDKIVTVTEKPINERNQSGQGNITESVDSSNKKDDTRKKMDLEHNTTIKTDNSCQSTLF